MIPPGSTPSCMTSRSRSASSKETAVYAPPGLPTRSGRPGALLRDFSAARAERPHRPAGAAHRSAPTDPNGTETWHRLAGAGRARDLPDRRSVAGGGLAWAWRCAEARRATGTRRFPVALTLALGLVQADDGGLLRSRRVRQPGTCSRRCHRRSLGARRVRGPGDRNRAHPGHPADPVTLRVEFLGLASAARCCRPCSQPGRPGPRRRAAAADPAAGPAGSARGRSGTRISCARWRETSCRWPGLGADVRRCLSSGRHRPVGRCRLVHGHARARPPGGGAAGGRGVTRRRCTRVRVARRPGRAARFGAAPSGRAARRTLTVPVADLGETGRIELTLAVAPVSRPGGAGRVRPAPRGPRRDRRRRPRRADHAAAERPGTAQAVPLGTSWRARRLPRATLVGGGEAAVGSSRPPDLDASCRPVLEPGSCSSRALLTPCSTCPTPACAPRRRRPPGTRSWPPRGRARAPRRSRRAAPTTRRDGAPMADLVRLAVGADQGTGPGAPCAAACPPHSWRPCWASSPACSPQGPVAGAGYVGLAARSGRAGRAAHPGAGRPGPTRTAAGREVRTSISACASRGRDLRPGHDRGKRLCRSSGTPFPPRARPLPGSCASSRPS